MRPVALVTGAGTGLGAYLAEHLARRGFDVAIHYRRSRDGASQTSRLCRAAGAQTGVWSGDLSRPSAARRLAEGIERKWGCLDVLVHNAGVYTAGKWDELSEASWRDGLKSTVESGYWISRACIHLLRTARAGRLVFIGDSSCEHPGARDLALSYHVGKTGVLMLARTIAQAEASHGITANVISPGYLENSVDLPSVEVVPVGRFGAFADIAAGLDFLISDEAAYFTGGHLLASGGWNLR